MKIATIVGARPQFIKAAVVSRALRDLPGVAESLVHTGQHYDRRMSDVFFEELGIPEPSHHLAIGSGPHGEQTGRMLIALEPVLREINPDVVLIYGDTNSTLAGALAAAKLHLPIAHVEAGLRSFNRRMPEEVNRVVADQLSSILFCPTEEAVANLAAEGITGGVHCVGDVMYEGAHWFAEQAVERDPLAEHALEPGGYALLTCHRAENTDDPERLAEVRRAIEALCELTKVVLPVHPRVRGLLADLLASPPPGLIATEPVGYGEMIRLTKNAEVVVTDSGGLQKEAFFFGVPCVTMRDETEWTETVACGANRLAGADATEIVSAYHAQRDRAGSLPDAGPYYGGGRAAETIARLLTEVGATTPINRSREISRDALASGSS